MYFGTERTTLLFLQCSTPSLIRTEVLRFKKIYVPITEFVRISEVAFIILRINNTKICGNPLLLV